MTRLLYSVFTFAFIFLSIAQADDKTAVVKIFDETKSPNGKIVAAKLAQGNKTGFYFINAKSGQISGDIIPF